MVREHLAGAARRITDYVDDLFAAEVANERHGGVSPSTLASAVESLAQGAGIMDRGWESADYIALLEIIALAGPDTEIDELWRARSCLPKENGTAMATNDEQMRHLYEFLVHEQPQWAEAAEWLRSQYPWDGPVPPGRDVPTAHVADGQLWFRDGVEGMGIAAGDLGPGELLEYLDDASADDPLGKTVAQVVVGLRVSQEHGEHPSCVVVYEDGSLSYYVLPLDEED